MSSFPISIAAASAAVSAVVLLAGCQDAPSSNAGDRPRGGAPALHSDGKRVAIALDDLSATSLTRLKVTSSAFKQGLPIPATYSDYGEKASPPLEIREVPVFAKSLLIICDDPDATEPKPFVHWVLYNVPPNITELRAGIPGTGQLRELMNAKQGVNSFGGVGYFGPKPPAGDPPHHYHFQIFALDQMLELDQAAKKADVIAAAQDHVIAAGELVGTFQQPLPK